MSTPMSAPLQNFTKGGNILKILKLKTPVMLWDSTKPYLICVPRHLYDRYVREGKVIDTKIVKDLDAPVSFAEQYLMDIARLKQRY